MTCGSIGGILPLVNPQKWGFLRGSRCGQPYGCVRTVTEAGSAAVVAGSAPVVAVAPASPAGWVAALPVLGVPGASAGVASPPAGGSAGPCVGVGSGAGAGVSGVAGAAGVSAASCGPLPTDCARGTGPPELSPERLRGRGPRAPPPAGRAPAPAFLGAPPPAPPGRRAAPPPPPPRAPAPPPPPPPP